MNGIYTTWVMYLKFIKFPDCKGPIGSLEVTGERPFWLLFSFHPKNSSLLSCEASYFPFSFYDRKAKSLAGVEHALTCRQIS